MVEVSCVVKVSTGVVGYLQPSFSLGQPKPFLPRAAQAPGTAYPLPHPLHILRTFASPTPSPTAP